MMVDDVDVSGHVFWVRWVRARIAKHNTSSGNDRYGAKQNMKKREHDRWRQTEHDKKEKWQAARALRIFCFFLVYVDKYQFPDRKI